MRLPHSVRALARALWRARRGRGWRLALLIVLSSLVCLALGVATASATSPLGPHLAHWSTTLDARLTLDLGPLGTASLDSPAGVLGVRVQVGEIPAVVASDSAASSTHEGAAAQLGSALRADGASYLALVSHPRLTLEAGVRALAADALRRAGLMESLVLTAVGLAHVLLPQGLAGVRLARGRRARLAAGMGMSLAVALVLGGLAPALRPGASAGTQLAVLRGTPIAQARLTGRVADVVAAYGPTARRQIEQSEAFYARARASLRQAWSASRELDGMVDVTAGPDGLRGSELSAARLAAQVRTRQLQAALQTPSPEEAAGRQASDQPTADQATATPSSGADPGSDQGEGTDGAAGTSTGPGQWDVATGPLAVARHGRTTAVLTTDMHCNLDMIALAGVLDSLADADVHLDDGDLTMTGSEPEQVCVDALTRAVPSSTAKVSTTGNHDSERTAAQLRARGWQVTDGEVHRVGGLRVLGDTDPDRSPAGGTVSRSGRTSQDVGEDLALASCRGQAPDLVLIHQPSTFGPQVASGCARLLVAGHSHRELGMSVVDGHAGPVAQLRAGAGQGGTSIGPVRQDAYLHVLSFDAAGRLRGWRAVVVHPDATVTVTAWHQVGPVGTEGEGAGQGVATAGAAVGAPSPSPSAASPEPGGEAQPAPLEVQDDPA